MSRLVDDVLRQVPVARRARGMSQRSLATLAETSQNTVSRIETGKKVPSLHVLVRLADALGCDVKLVERPEGTAVAAELAAAPAGATTTMTDPLRQPTESVNRPRRNPARPASAGCALPASAVVGEHDAGEVVAAAPTGATGKAAVTVLTPPHPRTRPAGRAPMTPKAQTAVDGRVLIDPDGDRLFVFHHGGEVMLCTTERGVRLDEAAAGELLGLLGADDLVRQLEDARQDAGRHRARIEAVEAVLQRIAEEAAEAVVDEDNVLYTVRQLLGLDGRTGDSDVNAGAAG